MCMGVLPPSMFVHHVCNQRPEKDPLKLELKMAVKHHMASGNQTQDLWKSSKC